MKRSKFLVALTIANTALLVFLLAETRFVMPARPAAPILRGSALEIVDNQGRVRSTLTVIPADPEAGYPETVLLRLIDSRGRPNTKIATTEDGSAISLGGQADPTYVQILARGASTSVKLSNRDGREQVIKP